jgi:hypothetical protein
MKTIFQLDSATPALTDYIPFGNVAEQTPNKDYVSGLIDSSAPIAKQIVEISTSGEEPVEGWDPVEVVCTDTTQDLWVRFVDGTYDTYIGLVTVILTLPPTPIDQQRVLFSISADSDYGIVAVQFFGDFVNVRGSLDGEWNCLYESGFAGSIIYSSELSNWVIDYGFTTI